MQTVFVKPKDGLQVRDARGRVIPVEGAELPRTGYVLRRMRDGDLVEATPELAAETIQSESEAKPRKGRKE